MSGISKQNVGNAGEYYFASVLSSKDFISTITLGRAERYDLLAVSPSGRTYKFSVKARYSKQAERFPLNKKDETGYSDDLFYAFIKLNELQELPEMWIVPSKRVSELLRDSHKKWMDTPNKSGGKHADGDIRNFWLVENRFYPNDWIKELDQYKGNFKQLK